MDRMNTSINNKIAYIMQMPWLNGLRLGLAIRCGGQYTLSMHTCFNQR